MKRGKANIVLQEQLKQKTKKKIKENWEKASMAEHENPSSTPEQKSCSSASTLNKQPQVPVFSFKILLFGDSKNWFFCWKFFVGYVWYERDLNTFWIFLVDFKNWFFCGNSLLVFLLVVADCIMSAIYLSCRGSVVSYFLCQYNSWIFSDFGTIWSWSNDLNMLIWGK